MINELLIDSAFKQKNSLLSHPKFQPSEPLWQRVPTHDDAGNPYADFVMLIPGLKKFEAVFLEEIINKLNSVFKLYEKDIILVDLNLKINTLWVTLRPRIGLSSEIAALIHHLVPQAKLISQHAI